MKHLRTFKLYENLDPSNIPGEIQPLEFLRFIGFSPIDCQRILEWWNVNRERFRIHYFPFRSREPIMGCFFEGHDIAINEIPRVPPPIKLFITLHESKHADQFMEGRFEDRYFQTVLRGDLEGFLDGYKELEEEANDYAINSLVELGFGNFILPEENRLRGNEGMGNRVYDMMSRDIARSGALSMSELLMNQII
jgi:hypothetical protein